MLFKKNEMIEDVLVNFYVTFGVTKNTDEIVPKNVNKRIVSLIERELFKRFKEVDSYYLCFLEEHGVKLGMRDRLKLWWNGGRGYYAFEKRVKLTEQQLKERHDKYLCALDKEEK